VILVDTHAHIYSEDDQKYPRIEKPLRPPAGKGTLEHLREEVQNNGIHRVVIVQTASAYRWDNRLTAQTVAASREWATGVCTLNPEDPASPGLLKRYVKESGFKGTRVFPTPGLTPGLGHDGHVRLWEAAAEAGALVCALIPPGACGDLARMLERFPHVPAVLDHCANLKASDGPDSDALRAVCALARFPNLTAKVTMVVTGSEEEVPCRDMHGIARRVIDAFGPDRCIWGSDFPCELWIPKATYAQHLRIFTHDLGLSASEQEAILGKTAMRLWFS